MGGPAAGKFWDHLRGRRARARCRTVNSVRLLQHHPTLSNINVRHADPFCLSATVLTPWVFLYSRLCRLCFQHPLAPQLPTFLQQLVYEKEKRLRMMMKMHGLGDGAYWLITYTWWWGGGAHDNEDARPGGRCLLAHHIQMNSQ